MKRSDDTTAKRSYVHPLTPVLLPDLYKTPLCDDGHNFKFSPTLGVYYCRNCRGVRSPKLGIVYER